MRANLLSNVKRMLPVVAAVCVMLATPVSAAVPEYDNKTGLGGINEQKLPPKAAVKPQIEVQQENRPREQPSDQTKIRVEKISITGQDIYSEESLQELVKAAYGKDLTLAELEVYARRIGQYFREQGYLVARAVVPAQTIENNTVKIKVLVGKYEKIELKNNSSLSETAANQILSPLNSGIYIQKNSLERVLLLLSDASGVSSKATLTAGSIPGTSVLYIELNDSAKTSGQAYVDNHGGRYTGKNRFGLNYNLHNLTGKGDFAALSAMLGKDTDDYSVSYQLPIGTQGSKLGIRYSRSHYDLGENFASLDASGVAKTTGIYETFIFKRSRDFNLNGRIVFDHKELEDSIDFFNTYSRKTANIWSIGISGDSRSQAGDIYNSFGLSFSLGRLSMDSPDAVNNDKTAQTDGHYSKTNLNLYQIHSLNNRLNLHFTFAGQLASKNLDSSEKISLGGANGVRAYPTSEASGDAGYVATGELRWSMPDPSLQLTAFVDCGHVTINKNPYLAGDNSRSLAGAGLGLMYSRPSDYALRLDYAWKLGSSDAVSDKDRAGRFWLQGIKYF